MTPRPQYDEISTAPDCSACGSNEVYHLGTLGSRDHFRCRQCGIDFSRAPRFKLRPGALLAEGIKTFNEEPLAYSWWLLHGVVDPERAIQLIHEQAHNDVMEETGQSAYSPSGQPFYSRPWVRWTRTRTLVVQRGGLDV